MFHGTRKNRFWFLWLLILCAVVLYNFIFSDETTITAASRDSFLVVVSVDALNTADWNQLMELPHFRELLTSGSSAREVVGVYPSLTYPAHASIITGVYPSRHGITANTLNQPGASQPEWYWHARNLQATPLWEIARKNRLRVGSLFWPSMAKAKVNYNLPEIWPVKKGQSQVGLALSNGSLSFLLDINLKFGKMLNGTHQPELDDFTTASACYLIKKRKPHLLLIHLIDLDHQRHVHGFMSSEAKEAIRRQDTRLGQIITSLKTAGIYERTNIVIIGDHGFLDVKMKINLNVAFKEAGLLSVDNNGNLAAWEAVVNSCDGSAHLYLKQPEDNELRHKVESLLQSLVDNPETGIEAIYNRGEADKLGVAKGPDYVLEAKEGYYFTNAWNGNLVEEIAPVPGEEPHVATHGFAPWKPGYRSLFIAAGPAVKQGVILPEIHLVDAAPTMAAMLGLTMENVDGRVLEEILLQP